MDIERSTLIIMLALGTLLIALAVGIFQRIRAGKAKLDNEHSALMDDPRMTHKEPRTPKGTGETDGNPRPASR